MKAILAIAGCVLLAQVTLLTSPQRGGGTFTPGAGGAAAQPQAPLPVGSGSISGVVLTTHSRAPIDAVNVQATGTTGTASVMTDASGRFTFNGIAPGNYRITARRAGYFGTPPNGNVSPMANVQVVVSAEQPNAVTEILLLEGAVVSGRVTDARGGPVPEARVYAIRLRYAGAEATLGLMGSGMTDANGNYRIAGVEPGEHYLRAAVIRDAAGLPIPSSVTYFPSGRDYSEGTLLTAASGSELVADIQILEGTRRRVSGRLAGADPGGLGIVSLGLIPEGAAALDSIEASAIQRTATPDGSFQVETMRPGVYELIAFTTTKRSGRVRVDLRDRDASDVTITLSPTVDLEVSFVGEGAASYTRGSIALVSIGMTLPFGLRPPIARAGFGARGQTTQTFTDVVEGRYSLVSAIQGNDGSYVADILQNGRSILDEGITVGKEKPAPVEVRVEAGGGVIEGTLQVQGEMPQAITVVAIPEGPRQQNSLLYGRLQQVGVRGLRGGARGTFRIRGMTPGRYKVFAFGSVLIPFAEQNREFMKPYEQQGVPVEVSLSGPAKITVPLIPAR